MRLRKKAKSVIFSQAFCLVAAIVLPIDAAYSASCSALKSELRKLESASGSQTPAARKWSSAKRQQQKAITAATRDARHFGCSNTNSAKCRDLNGKIKRMNSNLAAIERQLARSGGTSSKNTRKVRQVRAALEKQNCNAPARSRQARVEKPVNGEKQKSFFARLFNSEPRVEEVAAKTGDQEIASVRSTRNTGASPLRLPAGGAFRTLCVRTCDGYYFPVSFSTGRSQFANDEARCSEICPAAPTELYVYRNPGGDQSEMMSLAGVPYADQPFAFRYKAEFVEGCSCRLSKKSKNRSAWSEVGTSSENRVFFSDISSGLPQRDWQPASGTTFEEATPAASPLSRLPLNKTQLPPYEDPGTLFNIEKGFDVTAVLALDQNSSGAVTDNSTSDKVLQDGFPLLSLRTQTEEGSVETVAASPVFKTDDPGFRPAPERSSPVRVVGPEYFVAQ